MKAKQRRQLQQLDFWPELRSTAMVFYAACAGGCAPARSASEDGRAAASTTLPTEKPARNAPLGKAIRNTLSTDGQVLRKRGGRA